LHFFVKFRLDLKRRKKLHVLETHVETTNLLNTKFLTYKFTLFRSTTDEVLGTVEDSGCSAIGQQLLLLLLLGADNVPKISKSDRLLGAGEVGDNVEGGDMGGDKQVGDEPSDEHSP
jgi:hypothetical protein